MTWKKEGVADFPSMYDDLCADFSGEGWKKGNTAGELSLIRVKPKPQV